MNSVTAVLNASLTSVVYYILLKLWGLQGNLLLVCLLLIFYSTVIWINGGFCDNLLILLIASSHRSSTWVLLRLSRGIFSRETVSGVAIWSFLALTKLLFLVHLTIKCLSFIKYLHKLIIDFIWIQSFENILLMFKLILRLFSLLKSLLLLNNSIGILWLLLLLSNVR